MLAIAAAAIFLLEGLHVIESTAEITWWLVALGLLALSFVIEVFFPALGVGRWRRTPP